MTSNAQYPDLSSGWQPHQALITQLYRDEGRSLKEVKHFMHTQHGFKATKKMYKSKFKTWGLDKNNKGVEVRKILQLRAARKTLGKKSEFVLRGRPVDITDIERYAKRKGLTETSTEVFSDTLEQNLICRTPPSTPPTIDASTSLRKAEHFLFCHSSFLADSLQSGFWRLAGDIMGFATVQGAASPIRARNDFFLSIESGIQSLRWTERSQAFRHWRQALSHLQLIVRSRNPSQLFCFVELFANLAQYDGEVAYLILRYTGELARHGQAHSDTGLTMLQSLSRVEVKDLIEIDAVSRDCSWKAFRSYFSVESFFLSDSETILTDPGRTIEADVDLTKPGLDNLVTSLNVYNYNSSSLRNLRAVMELLIASEQYAEAKRLALNQIRQMEHLAV